MVHTKFSLSNWFKSVTNREIPQFSASPKFFYNTHWSKEEMLLCVNTLLKKDVFTHDIIFRVGTPDTLIDLGVGYFKFHYIESLPDHVYPQITLEIEMIKDYPIHIEVPCAETADQHELELKVSWLTSMGCHLVEKYYITQLFNYFWNATLYMEGTNNE